MAICNNLILKNIGADGDDRNPNLRFTIPLTMFYNVLNFYETFDFIELLP